MSLDQVPSAPATPTPEVSRSSGTDAGVATGQSWWRRSARVRNVAVWCLIVLAAGMVLALLGRAARPDTFLDPQGTGPQGIKAVLSVLRDREVTIHEVTTLDDLEAARAHVAAGQGATVALGNSVFLSDEGAQQLLDIVQSSDRLVLLDGGSSVLSIIAPEYSILPVAQGGKFTPQCDLRDTRDGSRVSTADLRFASSGEPAPDVAACYPLPTSPGEPPAGSLLLSVRATDSQAEVVALGFGSALTNRYIRDDDHAGIGLRLLGAHDELIVYTPSLADVAGSSGVRGDIVEPPAWLTPGLVILALAFVTYAVAAGRRLGRLVPEPLPVIIQASETTHSRAELYRLARDYGRAAEVLRVGAHTRLRQTLKLGPNAGPDEIVTALVGQGHPRTHVEPLLNGPAPVDNATLLHLARELSSLEQKVTSP